MRVAIITASTLGYKGKREDKSGPYIKKVVENAGFDPAFCGIRSYRHHHHTCHHYY